MELKEFVKQVIIDLDAAISEANTKTERDVRFRGIEGQKSSLEFDVAVTVESTDNAKAGGAIKVWGIGEIGANANAEQKNSTVSHVSFCIDISNLTKAEENERTELSIL